MSTVFWSLSYRRVTASMVVALLVGGCLGDPSGLVLEPDSAPPIDRGVEASMIDDVGAPDADDEDLGAPDARPGDGAAEDAADGAPEPPPERCNGEDDDGDGIADEGIAGGEPCTSDALGRCAPGTRDCFGGAWTCNSTVDPVDETCDGTDEDCDGRIDEGDDLLPLSTACYEGPPGTAGVGTCVEGVSACVDGAFGPCEDQRLPEAELCDRLDNDCNGAVDDLPGAACVCDAGDTRPCYTGPAGTEGVAACRGGTQSCAADGRAWEACADEVLPAAEVCNGIDEDCDGVADERVLNVCGGCGQEGIHQPGGCCVRDLNRCGACGAEPAEQCNGGDDDCDGRIDEGVVGCAPQMRCVPFRGTAGWEDARNDFPDWPPVEAAGRAANIRMLERYESAGDARFGFALYGIAGPLDRAVLYEGLPGQSYVSGQVCTLAPGGLGGVEISAAWAMDGGASATESLRRPQVDRAADEAVFGLPALFGPSDPDIDFEIRVRAGNPSGEVTATLGPGPETATFIASGYYLRFGPSIVIRQCSVDPRGGAGRATCDLVRPGEDWSEALDRPITSIMRMRTGGDADMSFDSSCDRNGADAWRCGAEVTRAGDIAQLGVDFLMIYKQDRL